jgi:hypothetical protein
MIRPAKEIDCRRAWISQLEANWSLDSGSPCLIAESNKPSGTAYGGLSEGDPAVAERPRWAKRIDPGPRSHKPTPSPCKTEVAALCCVAKPQCRAERQRGAGRA